MKRCSVVLLIAAFSLQAAVKYRVRLNASDGGKVVELPAEQYVAAVVAGEAGEFTEPEALKAMAVAARTYAAHFRSRHQGQGYDFCGTSHCQRVDLKNAAGRFQQAAVATKAQLLWFESRPALAAYTQDCGGRSESGQAVWPLDRAPYLLVHRDDYCDTARGHSWSWEIAANELARALQSSGIEVPPGFRGVVILDRTGSGRARTLWLVGGNASRPIAASSFRFAVGRSLGWNNVRSDLYRIEAIDGRIRIEGSGGGHGVGLCQNGAQEMAASGRSYKDILNFYYPGTTLSVLARDVKWECRLSGDVTVSASNQDDAHKVQAMATALLNEVSSRYGLAKPANIDIFVYPDMESYRNSTGEPSWIAAHAEGSRIDMQPLSTLQDHDGMRRVLAHELLHVMIESIATPGLPVWFREGLVENLAGETNSGAPTSSSSIADADFAVRQDADRTREAYRAAAARVQALRSRYGLPELLRWTREGIPPAAVRSIANNNVAKSK